MNNTKEFLESYLNEQDKQLPDALLCSGLLLSVSLLTLYCLSGGTIPLITTVCVLILGVGLGIIMSRYEPDRVWPWIHGMILTPPVHQPVLRPAH